MLCINATDGVSRVPLDVRALDTISGSVLTGSSVKVEVLMVAGEVLREPRQFDGSDMGLILVGGLGLR